MLHDSLQGMSTTFTEAEKRALGPTGKHIDLDKWIPQELDKGSAASLGIHGIEASDERSSY